MVCEIFDRGSGFSLEASTHLGLRKLGERTPFGFGYYHIANTNKANKKTIEVWIANS